MNNSIKSLFILLLYPFYCQAEVIDGSANGFSIQIERELAANQQQAYRQFLNISQWWLDDHTYFGNSNKLSINPNARGCFCEVDGDKQVLHMTVSDVEPNKEIRMIGGLGKMQMMGINGGMSWQFLAIDSKNIKIVHRYQVSGALEGGLDKLAPIVNKVQTLQVESLVSKILNK